MTCMFTFLIRKKEKPDLCAWFIEEGPDDTGMMYIHVKPKGCYNDALPAIMLTDLFD